MNVEQDVALKELEGLGLTNREARLYLALLTVEEASPATLQALSGVRRNKTYEALVHMVANGLCTERREGRHLFYRATPPDELHAMLKSRWESERLQRENTARGLFTTLMTLHDQSSTTPGLENIEILRSRAQISHRASTAMTECTQELLSFTRSPYAANTDEERAGVIALHEDFFQRGVAMRTIYQPEPEQLNWLVPFMHRLEALGEEVRVADVPLKMFIYDRRRTLLALPSVPSLEGSGHTVLAVDDPGFVAAMVMLFEACWATATPLASWRAP